VPSRETAALAMPRHELQVRQTAKEVVVNEPLH
jgi:hypothetical protein